MYYVVACQFVLLRRLVDFDKLNNLCIEMSKGSVMIVFFLSRPFRCQCRMIFFFGTLAFLFFSNHFIIKTGNKDPTNEKQHLKSCELFYPGVKHIFDMTLWLKYSYRWLRFIMTIVWGEYSKTFSPVCKMTHSCPHLCFLTTESEMWPLTHNFYFTFRLMFPLCAPAPSGPPPINQSLFWLEAASHAVYVQPRGL